MPELYSYEVGKPYDPTHRGPYPEGPHYNHTTGGHTLTLMFADPSAAEVQAVKRGPVALALYVPPDQPALLFLLARFGEPGGGVPWADAPFHWHRNPERLRQVPPTAAEAGLTNPDEYRVPLTTILVNARSGLVRAMRLVSLPPGLSTALVLAIRRQAELPAMTDAEYNAAIEQVYARYPTGEALAAAAQSRGIGGR